MALNYRRPDQRDLATVTLAEITQHQQEGHFKAGSMGPKVEACRRLVDRAGEAAVIARLNTLSMPWKAAQEQESLGKHLRAATDGIQEMFDGAGRWPATAMPSQTYVIMSCVFRSHSWEVPPQ